MWYVTSICNAKIALLRILVLQGTDVHCVYESVPFMIIQNPYQKYPAGGMNGAYELGAAREQAATAEEQAEEKGTLKLIAS